MHAKLRSDDLKDVIMCFRDFCLFVFLGLFGWLLLFPTVWNILPS